MYKLTIIMPSYNKEKYIVEALDSVFSQETSYSYQIIVADDCSTDGTIEIVKSYQERYPEKIILLESETNHGLYKNVLRAYNQTKSDYFCVLDPDDFWIDKFKIQKALDFLENNKDYTIYVTDTNILTLDGVIIPFIKRRRVIDSSLSDYFENHAALGCTQGSMFRNVIFKNGVPDNMVKLESETMQQSFRGDSFRSIIHLEKGKAHCVPEVDAIYRVTKEGLWQGSSKLEQELLTANFLKDAWLYFGKKYNELLVMSNSVLNKIKSDPDWVNKLGELNDDKKIACIKQLVDLEKLHSSYKTTEILKRKLKLKNKIRLFMYENLQKMLAKKGLI